MRISSQVSSRSSRRSSVFEMRKVRGCAENQTSISWFLCRWLKEKIGLVQCDVVMSNMVNAESWDSPERIAWLFKSSDWHAPRALYLWPTEPTRSLAIRGRSPVHRMPLVFGCDGIWLGSPNTKCENLFWNTRSREAARLSTPSPSGTRSSWALRGDIEEEELAEHDLLLLLSGRS